MQGAAGLLTLVTLLGLVSGLAREWLLVASWGAGARTDSFLIASFLPEAVRMMLSAGILSSASLALWQQQPKEGPDRARWLGRVTLGLGLGGTAMALILTLGAPWWARLIGPGLDSALLPMTGQALAIMAWAMPALVLQALWAVPLQARGRFLLAGSASLIYNLPAVLYLAWARQAANEHTLAATFVLGAYLTALLLLPSAIGHGLRPGLLRWHTVTLRELMSRLGHLLGGAITGQAMMLLERMVASYLGEGVVTVLNLARKLVNLPLIALMSVNQVLLGMMAKKAGSERLSLLRQGMALNTLVTTPAAVGMLLSAQAVVALLFPKVQGTAMLGPLLGWYAVALVLGGWNALLARYNHAAGDTRLPFLCEMSGNVAQAIALPLLAWLWGVQGVAVAVLLGVLVNGILLLHFNALWGRVRLPALLGAGGVSLVLSALVLLPHWPAEPLPRLGASTVAGLACLLTLALWLKPWKSEPA